MTIYDVLRRLVQLSPMGEQERADALAEIDSLQGWGALGTVAGQLAAEAHEHIPTYPNGYGTPPVCGLCRQIMEV
jgi:hypothetical protein